MVVGWLPGQKSLFPLSQETGSECAGDWEPGFENNRKPPPEGKGNCVKGPGGGLLTSPRCARAWA